MGTMVVAAKVSLLLLFMFQLLSPGRCSEDSLYDFVTAANISDSYRRVRTTPLKYFVFKYDSVPGRQQIGIIGPDAQQYFPESVEVIPTYSIPNRDRSKPATVLTNYPLVDKSVLFIHGLAALQELMARYDALNNTMASLGEKIARSRIIYEQIERRLAKEVETQIQEKELLAKAELELVMKERALEEFRTVDASNASVSKVVEEKELLDYESALSQKRFYLQDALAKDNMLVAIQREKDLAVERDRSRQHAQDRMLAKRIELAKQLDEKRKELELEKIVKELEAKAKYERENESVEIRKMQAKARMDTQRILDAIRMLSDQGKAIIDELLLHPERIALLVGMVLTLMLLYYTISEFIAIVRDFVKARLGRPTLVRETSVKWTLLPLPNFIRSLFAESMSSGLRRIEDVFKNVILSDDDKARVIQLALATRNTKMSGAPFRHVLLHGPPGTGKTLIARRLAESSGMDYAIMSGGDVGPLGEDAVSQLNSLFRWASRSSTGLLLFIDEAEAFLSARGKVGLVGADDSHVRHALNALLYRTSSGSCNFMLVLATNRPEDLDSAVLDRIDVSLYIGLPTQQQREKLVRLYMDVNLKSVALRLRRSWWPFSKKYSVDENCSSDDVIADIAEQCGGFSGREISKLFIACQYSLMTERRSFTVENLKQTVIAKMKEHEQKAGFTRSSNNNSPSNNNLKSKASARTVMSGQ